MSEFNFNLEQILALKNHNLEGVVIGRMQEAYGKPNQYLVEWLDGNKIIQNHWFVEAELTELSKI